MPPVGMGLSGLGSIHRIEERHSAKYFVLQRMKVRKRRDANEAVALFTVLSTMGTVSTHAVDSVDANTAAMITENRAGILWKQNLALRGPRFRPR